MKRKTSIKAAVTAIAIFSLLTFAAAQSGTILYNFAGGKDAANPKARLLLDSFGNLYGTATAGGANGQGAVFELSPNPSGGWTEQVLYSFKGGADGSLPAAGLIMDAAGNLYGTLYMGGALGHGAVFELQKQNGMWSNHLLYSFSGGNDGGQPVAPVIFDSLGNLYGTASLDGQYGQGVVFELSPNGQGGWNETVLHAFVSQSPDAQDPGGALTFDKAGNLYGLTVAGGTYNRGAAYKLTPNGDGTWTESVIYSFKGGTDGAYPATTDLFLKGNVFYGTTTNGGSPADAGTVFKLALTKTGWKEKVLYRFPGGANGGNPYAGVLMDSLGNLYGTTASGVFGGGGVVFKLTKVNSVWTETVLYTVDGAGNGSYADLVRDKAGNLYGTTEFGGTQSAGNVFEVTP